MANNLMISISGVRGIVGQSLTPALGAKYGAAYGLYLRQSRGKRQPLVTVGRDGRPSGEMVEHAVVSGLLAVGCRVVQLGIATTPTIGLMTQHLEADGGVVITASHNPIEWNGLKTIRHDGCAPPKEDAKEFLNYLNADHHSFVDVDQISPLTADTTANEVHVNKITSFIDVDAIREMRPKVVLDSIHGSGGPATAMLLDILGADIVHLHAEPTGQFPGKPEPTRENVAGVGEAVRQHHADIGFAQDPDADRLAILDEHGEYIGEEYTLALSAMHMLHRYGGGNLVANLSSSRMIDDVADQFGGKVFRAAVGEANVVSKMREVDALFGGEGNGGVIWPTIVSIRDSLVGVALMLEFLATSAKPVSDLVQAIPSYAMIKYKVPIQEGMAAAAINKLQSVYAGLEVDLQDGIRIDWPDKWAHVRASNTEPIMRIIVEAATEEEANALIAEVRGHISS